MSEAEQAKAIEPIIESSSVTDAAASSQSARQSNGVAWLALLLALGSAGAFGWQYWQSQQLVQQEQKVDPALQEQLSALQAAQTGWQTRLDQLAQAQPEETALAATVAQLQGLQQRQAQQLDRLQNDGRNELRLAEAEHLLRLAALRLSALQDVGSAKALIAGADGLLREQNDPSAFAARAELAKALEALQSRPAPDRTGLYLGLASLRTELLRLTAEVPSFAVQAVDPQVEGVEESRWQRWGQQLAGFVRIEFNSEHDIRPLLAGQQLDQVRLALSLAIEQAQWAVLNGQQSVYEQALKQAEEILQGQFGASKPQIEALIARLHSFAEQSLSFDAPDLTPALDAFSAYLQRRQALSQGIEVSQ